MATFSIKRGDTRPILEVSLKNPDGTAHDLTGSTTWKLHVKVNPGVTLTRDMVKQGLDTAGVLRYTFVTADWAGGANNLPSTGPAVEQLEMEYEVTAGTSVMTFPNDSYDVLQVLGDLG